MLGREISHPLQSQYGNEDGLFAKVEQINKIVDNNFSIIEKSKATNVINATMLQSQNILENAIPLLAICLDHDKRNDFDFRRLEARTYINMASVNEKLGQLTKPYLKQAIKALEKIPESKRDHQDFAKIELCDKKLKSISSHHFFQSIKNILLCSDKPEEIRQHKI